MLVESRYGPNCFILGAVLYDHPSWSYIGTEALTSVGWGFHGVYNDVFAYTLALCENHSPTIDLSDWGGYYGGREILHQGRQPVQAHLSPDGVRNWEQYIHNLTELFGGWNFAAVQSALSTEGRENPVQHTNLFGQIQSGLIESDFHRPNWGIYPVWYAEPIVWPYYNLTIHGSSWDEITGMTPSYQPNPGQFYPLSRLKPVLEFYRSWFNSGGNVATAGNQTHTYSNLSWEEYGGFVTSYSYTVNSFVNAGHDPYVYSRSYDVKYEFWLEHISVPPLETEFTVRDHVAIRGKVDYVLWSDMARLRTEPSNWVPTSQIHGNYTSSSASFPISGITNWLAAAGSNIPRFGELVGKLDNGTLYDSGSGKTLVGFESKVRSFAVDSNALYFLSSADAVSVAFPQFESNHVEGLLELRSLGDLLNPIKLATTLVKRARGGKKVSIKSLLDLLTDVHLSYSLGLAPTVSDAMDIARRARNLRVRYSQDLNSPVTAYGKFLLPPDDALWAPYGGTYVVARSKLRVSMSEDTWWMALMPFHAMNLLPTFSNIWDLLPLSFVVDYFLNIGDSLEAADTAAFFLGLEVEYAVHSTAFVYPFDIEEDCDPYGFHPRKDGENVDAGYKIYNRWVSSELPQLTPTRFNVFGGPNPNYGILGSLLYKFL